jgi:hypothetical protein
MPSLVNGPLVPIHSGPVSQWGRERRYRRSSLAAYGEMWASLDLTDLALGTSI